jgi:quaternary ammonium compound-resistance protein SugE
MAWLLLIIAGLLEIVWAVGMKYSLGWTRLWPSVITIVTIMVSVYLLSVSMRDLPVGTAYAVWVGIGAVGAALLGILLFNEPVTLMRVACLGLIIAGVIGLRLAA